MANEEEKAAGREAIKKLKTTNPPLFLSPNTELSNASRVASKYLFATLKPYSPKSPFDQLLTDGFDAEQIWQQIDLQSHPLLSSLKRELKRFDDDRDLISIGFDKREANGDVGLVNDGQGLDGSSQDDDDSGGDDDDDGDMMENGVVEEEEEDDDDDDDGSDDDDDEDEDEEIEDEDGVPEVEDQFLKVKELEKFLVREEKREYGSEDNINNNKKRKKKAWKAADEDEEQDEEEEESEGPEEDDEMLLYGDDDEKEDGAGADIRYDDFFVPDKKKAKRNQKRADKLDDSEMEDEDDEQKEENLSTYEKERLKIQAKIKEMEQANLDPKDWTMQGEVTAAKRPKDSALEVDLDFEHNMRPPPVITDEVTESLEEIIKKRILEGNFDDVERAPKLPSAAPRERKELDENKSKKGLAEIYEEEYAQQTGLASAPVSFNDELKKEASQLFKRLCLNLDALSHFHFAPKPVVEDMSVQTNVPALAMEEIAPVAVSDAAMLAPEEVFAGKGDVKEETELTKEDRKRRRAKKKRKLKAVNAKKSVNRATKKPSQTLAEGKGH